MRRIGAAALIAVALYGLAGFFGIPMLVRHLVAPRLAASLGRPLSVGRIAFNPYTLRLEIDRLHLAERGGAAPPFVDIGRLRLKLSWSSLVRLAPVIGQVRIDHPAIHIVRSAANRFNFSDLLEPSGAAPAAPRRAAASKPYRFAISNIELHNGEIHFDDAVLGEKHLIKDIQIGLPFIADLPSDVNIYVQPLLRMVVDGSPFRIAGKAKPFATPPESVINLNLHRLDLPRFAGYLPEKLAVKIPAGTLSSELRIHFVNGGQRPLIRVGGEAALDQLDLRDAADAPLANLRHAMVALSDVEPLEDVAHLERIYIDGLTVRVVRNPDGTINLASLMGGKPAAASPKPMAANVAQAAPSPPPSTAAAAPAAPTSKRPTAFDLTLKSFELVNSAVQLTDKTGPAPAMLAIQGIHFGVQNLDTGAQAPPASFALAATLGGGGALAVKGSLDPARSRITADISLDQIDLPALQAFAQSMLAATVATGKLSAHAKVQTQFAGGHFNLHAEPADASLDNFELRAPNQNESPLGWTRLSVSVAQADLAAHQATVSQVRADGLRLFARRERDGELSLASLIRKPPSSAAAAPTSPAPATRPSAPERHERSPSRERRATSSPRRRNSPPSAPATTWTYRIGSIDMENAQVRVEDQSGPGPVALAVAPLNMHLKDVSSDFAKPIAVEVDGKVNGKGGFKIAGSAALSPLKAKLRVMTRRVDLAAANPYVSGRLNATIKNAALSINGALDAAEVRDRLRLKFRGDAIVGGVRMLDKVSTESFLVWNSFSARRIDLDLGSGPPRIHIGALALADFYARVILNRDGHLNLRDIVARPQSAPTSLTHPEPAPAAATLAPGPPAAPAAEPIAADIEFGEITFEGGRINYTDNFIQPNYTANLTHVSGKVGTFGTRSTAPAGVALSGRINRGAPIDISGSVNPLAPMAYVDIKAKADDIELPDLTAYSAKYTGYPITRGTLTVDVHYLLDQQKLSAENHIFIDQLTFGDKVESPSATNLPIRLAVALLKNPAGEIDLNVPISGSLSDPQFSIGGVILHAFMNLILKAATSPFSLLAAAVGGGGANEDYSHIDFAPGWATLTPAARKQLDILAKALQHRPALKLSITGRVDPEFDRDGLREAMLTMAIRAQKIKALGSEAAGADPATIRVAPDEYGKYLWRAYKAADFAKPRNLIGMTKSLPQDEMKKLMLANTKVTDADLRQLADARAAAVRKALAASVDASRLSVTAPKLNADGIKDKGKTTRVDLSLQ